MINKYIPESFFEHRIRMHAVKVQNESLLNSARRWRQLISVLRRQINEQIRKKHNIEPGRRDGRLITEYNHSVHRMKVDGNRLTIEMRIPDGDSYEPQYYSFPAYYLSMSEDDILVYERNKAITEHYRRCGQYDKKREGVLS